jgi:hypothetical protein
LITWEEKGWGNWFYNLFFLELTHPYKNVNEAHQRFIEDLVMYIYKGYMPLSTCEKIWLRRLVLHQCPHIVFHSCSSLVE